GPNGPQPLANGDYTISLQCLGPQHNGCATVEGEPSAIFHLLGSASTQCQPGQPCTSLLFSPARAAPGAQVQVTGWAPIPGLIGGQPIPYSLVLQIPNQNPFELGPITQDTAGNVTGGFKVPQQIPGLGSLQPGSYLLALQPLRLTKSGGSPEKVAATPFEITAAATWASLKLGAPLWIEPSASLFAPQVTVDPTNPLRLAYCEAGDIKLRIDGGRKWTAISIAGVVNALAHTPYTLGVSQTPDQVVCESLTLDPKHADSYFAVFQTTNAKIGAPPVYWMGLSTSDAGNVWKLVPAPANSSPEQFGGFWTDGQGVVQALFSGPGNGMEQSPPVLAVQTGDGGKTWSPASLTCPPGGSCIRWNGAPGMVGGMGAPLPQWVMVSIDGGSNWMAPGPTVELREEGPHELAAFSDKMAILLAGNGEYPLRVTQDGGQSWSAVSLPPEPGADPANPTFPGLQILPDGSLLAQPAGGKSWSLLAPGAAGWCALASPSLPSAAVLLHTAGDSLWWQNPADLKVSSFPANQLRCGQ
ncbi:MAG TPA: sialidase family protein, partial [Anaerolineales bacterium]